MTDSEHKRRDAQRPSSQDDNTAPSSLSQRQKQLLASFGVVSSGQSQRLPEPHGRGVKCQDIPACLVDKTLATSPFSPTFIQPHQTADPQNQELNMPHSTFDPSKYGAPPKKQRLASSNTQKTAFEKPGAPQVPLLDRASAIVQVQRSSSVTQSTISEVTDHTMDIHTSPTGISDASKTMDIQALKPKSPNKPLGPRFDRTKYGKRDPKKSRKVAQDGANVKTATGAGQKNLKTSDPTVPIHPTVSLQTPLALVTLAPRSPQKSLEHPGSVAVPENTAEASNEVIQKQPPEVSHYELVLKAPHTEKASLHSQAPTLKTLPSSIPPPRNLISKEEQLKQVQQSALRDIGVRNRHKGDAPETTSLRNLRIARAAATSTPPSTAVAAVSSMMNHSPAESASTPENPRIAHIQNRPCAPKLSTSMPAAPSGMSKEDHLKQVQQARLREIGMRNRGDGRIPETTSLVDLNIARTPVRSDTPSVSAPVSSLNLVQPTGYNTPLSPPVDIAINQSNTLEPQSREAASGAPNILSKTSRNSRWCTKEELRPEPNLETNSNAWGSEVPTNGSGASSDSLRPMHLHGRLFTGPPPPDYDDVAALVGWDGKMQPPPVDWNDRPCYNNNSSAFRNGLNNWFATAAAGCHESEDRTLMFKNIPRHVISNVEWYPDGIAMTRREHTLNAQNISKYGYEIDPADVAKYAEEVKPEDYEDWGKLDMKESDNVRFKDETTEQLVKNWLAHYANSKKAISLALLSGHKRTKASKVPKPEVNPHEPSLNIYLRPAVKADLQQMTDLYNWWVEKSVRPAEVRPIDIHDMELRFDTSKGDDRLPFIVAILKAKKEVQRNMSNGVKVEQVVGFALASGFTAADYVEHIAAELEIYVHHNYLRQGIGRCLMDRLMCATDRGHMERGGYPFHCDPVERVWYEVGGARDLHKIMFVARQYSRPRKDSPEELDVTTWMKKWLVKDWDFEEEACLKQAGAKNGRFLDLTYFTKFSKWLPEDGRVPGPEPRDFKKQ